MICDTHDQILSTNTWPYPNLASLFFAHHSPVHQTSPKLRQDETQQSFFEVRCLFVEWIVSSLQDIEVYQAHDSRSGENMVLDENLPERVVVGRIKYNPQNRQHTHSHTHTHHHGSSNCWTNILIPSKLEEVTHWGPIVWCSRSTRHWMRTPMR